MTTEYLFGAVLLFAIAYLLLPRPARRLYLAASSIAFAIHGGRQSTLFFLLSGLSAWGAALITGTLRTSAGQKARQETDPVLKKQIKRKASRLGNLVTFTALLIQFSLLIFLKLLPGFPQAVLSFLLHREIHLPHLFVPFGISFFTFMFASYTLDVCAGKLKPCKNPLHVLVYAGYPLQLLQGPIGRFADLDRQFWKDTPVSLPDIRRGLLLMCFGLFKKKVIADRAAGFVNAVFDNPAVPYGGAVNVLAVLLYSLQQYCDFSGGIDIVLGGARIMGIYLSQNFRQPYFSTSLSEFWRRWHMTLGAWMRDYVFYPIALSKPVSALSSLFKKRIPFLAKALPAVIANIIVFLLVGLWHGATGHYVVWGLYNGVIIALAVLLEPLNKSITKRLPFTDSKGFHVFRILRTFLIVNIGWFFDRASATGQAITMLRSICAPHPEQLTPAFLSANGLPPQNLLILLFSACFFFVISILKERHIDIPERLMQFPVPVRWSLIFCLLLATALFFDTGNTRSFMYAAF